MFDIDHFKRANDLYGHATGGQDALLARGDQRLYFAKSSGRNRVES